MDQDEELSKKMLDILKFLEQYHGEERMLKTMVACCTIVGNTLRMAKPEVHDQVRSLAWDSFAVMMTKDSDVSLKVQKIKRN